MNKIIRFLSNEKIAKNEKLFDIDKDVELKFAYYKDMVYISGKGIYHKKLGFLNDIDIAWITGNGYLDFKRGITYFYKLNNTKIVDSRLKSMLDDSKFSQTIFLDKYGFNIPKTLFLYLQDEWIEFVEKNISYPLILKDIYLDRGEGVFIVKNNNEFRKFIEENNNKPFLIQEFIENKGDWRVVVVDGKILGGFRRYSETDFKNNFSQGGEVYFEEIPDILKEKAIEICSGYEIEIGGIDFFYEDEKYYVIEINRLPQTNAFKQKYGNIYEKEVIKMFKKMIKENGNNSNYR